MKSTLTIFALFLVSAVSAERYDGRQLMEVDDVGFPEYRERRLMHRRLPRIAYGVNIPGPNRRLGFFKKIKKVAQKVKKLKDKIKKFRDRFGRVCDVASVVGFTCPGRGILYDEDYEDDEDNTMAYSGLHDLDRYRERRLVHRRLPRVAYGVNIPGPNRRLGFFKKIKKVAQKVKKLKDKIKKFRDRFGRVCDVASVVGFTCPGRGILYDEDYEDDEDNTMAYSGLHDFDRYRERRLWKKKKKSILSSFGLLIRV